MWMPTRPWNLWTVWDCWRLGVTEAGMATGLTFYNDPEHPKSVAYDEGRNYGEACKGL